jgi:hypothetical protein
MPASESLDALGFPRGGIEVLSGDPRGPAGVAQDPIADDHWVLVGVPRAEGIELQVLGGDPHGSLDDDGVRHVDSHRR